MNIFFAVVAFCFWLWVLRNTLFWVGLWQDKEYRWDRLSVHFKETIQGRNVLFSPWNILKWLLFFFYGVVILQDSLQSWYELSIGLLFVIQAIFVIKNVLQHRIKRPVFTKKAILLVSLSVLFTAILFVAPLVNIFVWLLFLDRILPLIVVFFVALFAFPTEIHRDILIQQARKKMEKYNDVKVIAVSGSYGKTSTKEYISQVLSKKFNVVKTPASNNTPVGIAKTILNNIDPTTEIFVVEMGAYKKGEIAALCKIVQPHISVTTSVSDQHISLYGSLKNVFESENELLQALPKEGLALFNGNNANAVALSKGFSKKKIIYKCFKSFAEINSPVGAYNIKASPDGVIFTAVLDEKKFLCKCNLLGNHVVENVLPAIYLGHFMGMSLEEISEAVKGLAAPSQTLTKIKLANEMVGIDDTFNVSPESVLSAMDYLSLYKKKKIFVLSPLTELGKNVKERYFEIGKKAAISCDYLMLLNKNFSGEIIKGIKQSNGKCTIEVGRPEILAQKIKEAAQKGDAVLFEGKEAKMVMKKLV